jgi:hypothetical protein
MTKRMLITLILALAVVAVVVVAVVASNKGGGSNKAVSSSTTSSGESESDIKLDNQDPNQSGCAPTAVNVSGSRVPMVGPGGHPKTTLFLRRSTACQAIWGEVKPLEGRSHYLVEVEVHRPANAGRAAYSGLDEASYVFGNMLSARPGCVYATAYLEQDGKRGPVAQTPCRK